MLIVTGRECGIVSELKCRAVFSRLVFPALCVLQVRLCTLWGEMRLLGLQGWEYK